MSSAHITRRQLLSGTAALAAYAVLPRFAWAADAVPASRLVSGGSWGGLVGVSGGIPTYDTQYGSTIAPYTGSASTINTALSNAPDDTYVRLGPGTFNLSSSISIQNSRVVLRGSVDADGKPTTVLNYTNISDSAIVLAASGWDISNAAQFTTVNVTAGVSRGSTTVTLASTPTTLALAQMMLISAPRVGNTSTPAYWSDFLGSRPFTQWVRVTAKNGNNVTFSPAINADFLSGTIQVHWRSQSTSIKLSGIEDLSLTRNSGVGGHYVRMQGADQCWAKNIKTTKVSSTGYHHYLYACYRCEIRHCDASAMDSLSSSTYVLAPVHCSQLLIEDNYFHNVPNVMPMFGLNGSAFAYNYINDLPYSSPGWLSQIVYFHGSHCHYNLFEGNWCPASYNDSDGDGSRNNVWLRNRMRGWDATGPKTSNCQAMTLCPTHTNLVMAGNVLGEAGFHRALLSTFSGSSNFPNTIYNFSTASVVDLVANYNTVNGAIPSAEALAGGETLADSYLHSSKPSWFGSLAWPPIEPTNYAQSNEPENLPAGYRAINGRDVVPADPAPRPPTSVLVK